MRLPNHAATAEPVTVDDLSATPLDPLSELIADFRRASAYFDKHGPEDNEGADELAAVTFKPSWRRLSCAPPAPTTWAGAIEGMEFFFEGHCVAELHDMLKACVAFVKRSRLEMLALAAGSGNEGEDSRS